MHSMMTTSVGDRTVPQDPARFHAESLELAWRMVEKHICADGTFPSLMALTQISVQGNPSVSGRMEYDYNSLNGAGARPGLSNIKQLSTIAKSPLPPEIVEGFRHMQCHWMMGLFPEIDRAWVTIDSDIYMWSYEGVSDVAFFEGMSEVIVSVGLVKPKPGVFHNFVQYLLILTSTVEILVLGLTFSNSTIGPLGKMEVMNLLPDPVFVIPTDGITVNTIACANNGRIFLGGREGSLLEVVYQAESGWFGKRCKKVNHSTSSFSFLVPSFLNVAFSDEDAITNIVIDDTRHILYTLSDKGTITVYFLGDDGNSMSKVMSMSQSTIVQTAARITNSLDNTMFRPVKSIGVIELKESPQLNLVAVSESGVRLYFTTSSVVSPRSKPYTLQLMHVRLPPGYAGGDPPSQRPVNVHMAHYRRGTLLLATAPTPECNMLWCLSGDSYPFYPYLFEEPTVVPLTGIVWSIVEARPSRDTVKSHEEALTPLVVRQHYEEPCKYIVLTPQGAEIFMKLRPVDLLRQLLFDNRGPESEVIKTYFAVQKDEQACATSLIIACNESAQNMQLAEWATRAFFLYGGEPKMALAPQPLANPGMTSPIGSPSIMSFNPGTMSTPNQANNQPMTSPIDHRASFINFSAKHNGLYLYLGRILRPLWCLRLVYCTTVENNHEFLSNSASREDCIQILSHLHSLRAFLEKNTQFSSAGASGRSFHNTTNINNHLEAQMEEKKSLDALKVFVSHTCEVLGLWRILCEHQFHIIADLLSRDHKKQLIDMAFRNLILAGNEMCSVLIQSLINRYLNDNAPVDSICSKMREICPTLYRNEDAACSKANEMLLLARKTQNKDERNEHLQAALANCKSVAPLINLPVICQLFIGSQFYEGVLELSATCAKRLDPKDVAVHYYMNNEPPEDAEGIQAYNRRMDCYKEVTNILDHLFGQSQSSPYTSLIPMAPGGPTQPMSNPMLHVDTGAAARHLLKSALELDDQLLHISIYNWMMSKGLNADLISINKPSLGTYLKKAVRQCANNVPVYDLLWKYHEKNQDHRAAAEILYKLAVEEGNLELVQRVDYLARAVMCMRSEKIGAAPHLGVFLRELEDQLQVAKLQQQVYEAILKLGNREDAKQAVQKLNSGLVEITVLYESYAEPFNLWAAKLAIIHVSGHADQTLVENIWLNMIEAEVRDCSAIHPVDKMSIVLTKVKSLGQEYKLTTRCFPIPFLIRFLEIQSCRLEAGYKQVFTAMLELDVSYGKLMEVYEKLVASSERCWANEGDEFHLVHVIVDLVDSFAQTAKRMNAKDRRATVAQAADVQLSCLKALYSKPGTVDLVTKVKAMQSKLDRMIT